MVISFLELVLMAAIAYSILQKKFESNSDFFKKILKWKVFCVLVARIVFLTFLLFECMWVCVSLFLY